MKATVRDPKASPPEFEPVEVTITFESAEELRYASKFFGATITVPRKLSSVKGAHYMPEHKSRKLMQTIHTAVREARDLREL